MSNNKLEIKKIYIDSRFKTSDSKSDTDFNFELPRTFNIPDGVVAYIDDIVIPISFSTVDARNNNLYIKFLYDGFYYYKQLTMDSKNYSGTTFAEALKTKLNAAVVPYKLNFETTYDYTDNLLTIKVNDTRPVQNTPLVVVFLSDADLKNGEYNNTPISSPKTLNQILRINANMVFYGNGGQNKIYIDLHTTRNLYLTSSALASYNIVSNFGNDTIIKKIPVRAGFNEMLFDEGADGMDYLDVSRRTLRYIDFKLVDSYFNVVDLRNNHFSFSILFEVKR
jgi:hypothetical protein